MLAFVTFPVWIVSFSLNKLYQARAVERPTEEFRRIVNASLVSVGVIVAVAFVLPVQGAVAALDPVAARVRRRCCMVDRAHDRPADLHQAAPGRRRSAGRCSSSAPMPTPSPCCTPPSARRTSATASSASSAPTTSASRGGVHGPRRRSTRPSEVLEATGATGVLISLSSVESEVVNRLTRELTDGGYHVALSSGLRDIDVVRFRAQDLGGRTLIYVEQIQRGGWRAVAKRVFDITVALVALLLTAPITLVAAIAIKRSSTGPGDLRPGARRPRRRRRSACSSSARWSSTPRPARPSSAATTRPTGRCSRWPTTRGSRRSARSCASCRSTRSRSSSTCCAAR